MTSTPQPSLGVHTAAYHSSQSPGCQGPWARARSGPGPGLREQEARGAPPASALGWGGWAALSCTGSWPWRRWPGEAAPGEAPWGLGHAGCSPESLWWPVRPRSAPPGPSSPALPPLEAWERGQARVSAAPALQAVRPTGWGLLPPGGVQAWEAQPCAPSPTPTAAAAHWHSCPFHAGPGVRALTGTMHPTLIPPALRQPSAHPQGHTNGSPGLGLGVGCAGLPGASPEPPWPAHKQSLRGLGPLTS